MSYGRVDRCVCLDITFVELKRRSEKEHLDFDALSRATGCCTVCTSCEPYVRLMLRTGQTDFHVLSPNEVVEALRN